MKSPLLSSLIDMIQPQQAVNCYSTQTAKTLASYEVALVVPHIGLHLP
jgi:hypothetical protein